MVRPAAWDAYERAAMAGEAPESPGEEYVMGEAFQAWLVDRLRDDVLGQVASSGLDRMAILRRPLNEPDGEGADEDADDHDGEPSLDG